MPCVFSSSRPSFFPEPGSCSASLFPAGVAEPALTCRCHRSLVTMALALSAIPITQIPITQIPITQNPITQTPITRHCPLPGWSRMDAGLIPHFVLSHSDGEGMALREMRMEDVLTLIFLQESALLRNPWESLLTPELSIFRAMELAGQDLRCSQGQDLRCPTGTCPLLGCRYVGSTPQCPAPGTSAQGARVGLAVFSGSSWGFGSCQNQLESSALMNLMDFN